MKSGNASLHALTRWIMLDNFPPGVRETGTPPYLIELNMKSNTLKPSKKAPTTAKTEAPKPAKKPLQVVPQRSTRPEPTPVEQVTIVTARVDVGLGNNLFIRGEGDGLSWDKGAALDCVDASTWVWSTKATKDRIVFKLLLNDQIWAAGDNVIVEAGRQVEVAPGF